MPPKKRFHETLLSYGPDQLASHTKREAQGNDPQHEQLKTGLRYQKQELTVCLGEAKVLVPHQVDYPFDVVNNHCSHEVKEGIPDCYVDQRPVAQPSLAQERVYDQDNLRHDERSSEVFGRFFRADAVRAENGGTSEGQQTER